MLKDYSPTRLQGGIAIASFSVGTIIACVCLFAIPPYGTIETSAISLVSEFLILCGALLGAKVAFDVKLQRFEGELQRKVQDAVAWDELKKDKDER